jgi:hypothetical protein
MQKMHLCQGRKSFHFLWTPDCNFGLDKRWGFLGETNKALYFLEGKFRLFILLYFIPYRFFYYFCGLRLQDSNYNIPNVSFCNNLIFTDQLAQPYKSEIKSVTKKVTFIYSWCLDVWKDLCRRNRWYLC